MAGTVYPNGIDNNSTLPQVVDMVTPVKAEVVNNLRNAIIAIESELGLDPSREYGTVRARLDALSEVISTTRGGISQVKQDGVAVVAPVTKLNFTGNVVVTDAGDCQADVQILSQALSVIQETINPIINGQTQFTLSCSPSQDATVQMFINGVKQQYGVDYTVTGKTVTYLGSHSTITTDDVEFYYIASGGVGHQETKAVTVAGQVDFYLSAVPLSASVVQMFINGAKQQYSVDYDGVTVHMVYSGPLTLQTTDVVEFWYISAAGADCVSGDVNDAVNVGTGEDVFRDKIAGILYFKKINVVNGLTVSTIEDSVVIDGYDLLQRDGYYPMTGNLDMGGHDIINVGNLGYTTHATRHQDGGDDEIDGYLISIDYVPNNYIAISNTIGGNLEGIDNELGSYLRLDGTSSMFGDINLDGYNLTNVELINGIDYEAHASRHENGGADEISVNGLSGVLIEAQKLGIRKSGTLVGTRPNLNLIAGANISLFMVDSALNDRVDVTITAAGGGGGGGVDAHALSHIYGASDQISGDNLAILWSPSHYTPDTDPSEVSDTSELTAHLAGIDGYIGNLTNDHGELTGLSDDDHSQYLLISGTRAMTGDLDMGGQDINSAKDGYFTGNGYFGGKLTVKGLIDPTALVLDQQNATPVGAVGSTKGVLWTKAVGRGNQVPATTPYFTDSLGEEHLLAYDGYIVRDHGDLTGLSDDDHSQYLLVSGTRAMTGGLNMGTNNITSCGTINSVSITAHGSRHNPGGTDAATTGVPSTTAVILGNSVLEGSALSFARSDHIHAVTAGTPVAIGTTNTTGNATTFSASNHIHDHGALLGGDRHAAVTTAINGFMTATDKLKLDNISSGAGVSYNAFSYFTDGTNIAAADGYQSTFKIRTANNLLTTLVTNNDVTHGDNVLFTVNQSNIDHGSIAGLTDDDHANYVHLSNARTITAKHIFNTTTQGAPFQIGANSDGYLVEGLNAQKLNGYQSGDFVNIYDMLNTTLPLTGGGQIGTTGGGLTLGIDYVGADYKGAVAPWGTDTYCVLGSEQLSDSGGKWIKITNDYMAPNAIGFSNLQNAIEVSVSLPTSIHWYVNAINIYPKNFWGYSLQINAFSYTTNGFSSKTYILSLDYTGRASMVGTLVPICKTTNASNDWELECANAGDGSVNIRARRSLGTTACTVHVSAYSVDGYATLTAITGTGTSIYSGVFLNNYMTVNGASVPIANSLTTNHILKVSGVSALEYGYIGNANISDTAEIYVSKLAAGSVAGQVLMTSTGVTTAWQSQSNLDHGSIGGLSDDDHANYVHISTARTITARHAFNTTTVGAPFTIGANSYNQLVTGFNADQVDGYSAGHFVHTTRTLYATAPIEIDGLSSHNLASDITFSVNDATTGAVGVIKLANDLGGTGLLPTVLKVNGATVPSAGALTTSHVLKVSGTSALSYGYILNANIDASADIAVSKLANGTTGQFLITSGTTPTWVTRSVSTTAPLAGGGSLASDLTLTVSDATTTTVGVVKLANDLGGTGLLPTVLKVNGATVPAAGALTTNHILKVSGVSALTYGYIVNANIDASADIAVSKLANGTTGQFLITSGTTPTWVTRSVSTTAPLAGGGSLASDLTLTVSDATTTTVGVVKLANDLGGTGLLPEVLKINKATVPAAGALTTNHVLKVSGVSALGYGYIVNANIDAAADIAVSKLANSTANYVVKTNSAGTTVEQGYITDANISSTAGITITKITAGATNTLLWTNSSDVVTWSGTPTISTLTLTSVLTFGTAASSTGTIRFGNGASIYFRNAANDGNVLALNVTSGDDVVVGSTNTDSLLYLQSGTSYIRVTGTTAFDGTIGLYSVGALTFDSASLTPTINQGSISTAAGQDMTISAQSSTWANTAGVGGDLWITSGGNGVGATASSAVYIRNAGTTRVSVLSDRTVIDYSDGSGGKVTIRDLVSTATHGAIYMGSSSPSATNYILESEGTTSILNAGTTVKLAIANTTKFEVTSTAIYSNVGYFYNELITSNWVIEHQPISSGTVRSLSIKAQSNTALTSTGGSLNLYSGEGTSTNGTIYFYNGATTVLAISGGANLRFIDSVVNPQIYQSASGTVGGAGQPLKIIAQSNTTTGGTGGDLILTSGAGQTNAVDGDLYLETGDNTRVKISNLSATFYPEGTSRIVFTDTEATFSFGGSTGKVVLRDWASNALYGAIYFGTITPSTTNYTLLSLGTSAYLNAESGGVNFRINNATRAAVTDTTFTVYPSNTARMTVNTTAATFDYGSSGKVVLRDWTNTASYGAIYLGDITPDDTNYAVASGGTATFINAGSTLAAGAIYFKVSNVTKATITSEACFILEGSGTMSPSVTSGGIGLFANSENALAVKLATGRINSLFPYIAGSTTNNATEYITEKTVASATTSQTWAINLYTINGKIYTNCCFEIEVYHARFNIDGAGSGTNISRHLFGINNYAGTLSVQSNHSMSGVGGSSLFAGTVSATVSSSTVTFTFLNDSTDHCKHFMKAIIRVYDAS